MQQPVQTVCIGTHDQGPLRQTVSREIEEGVAAWYGRAWVAEHLIDERADAVEELPERALCRLPDGTWVLVDVRRLRNAASPPLQVRCVLLGPDRSPRAAPTRPMHQLMRERNISRQSLQRRGSFAFRPIVMTISRVEVYLRSWDASLRKTQCIRSNAHQRVVAREAEREQKQRRDHAARQRLRELRREHAGRGAPAGDATAAAVAPRMLTPPPAADLVGDEERRSPRNSVEVVELGNDDESGEPERANEQRLDPEEVRAAKRHRALREFDTFMPPNATDVVQPGSLTECSVCMEVIPPGPRDGLVARGVAPCRMPPMCRECLGRLLDSDLRRRQPPTCQYCPTRHVLPALAFARVLRSADFVRARTELAKLQNGAVPGWEATRACPRSACGRTGLMLCMNSPAFSCPFCHAAPREGWCAFCLQDYSSAHSCVTDRVRSLTLADVLYLIDVEHAPVVHPCPVCRELTQKGNPNECNHMTCGSCRSQYCGACGADYDAGHFTRCPVTRANEDLNGPRSNYLQAHENVYVMASVVAAYAQLLGEQVPDDLRRALARVEAHTPGSSAAG